MRMSIDAEGASEGDEVAGFPPEVPGRDGLKAEESIPAISSGAQCAVMLSGNLEFSSTKTSVGARSPRIEAEDVSSSFRMSPRPSALP